MENHNKIILSIFVLLPLFTGGLAVGGLQAAYATLFGCGDGTCEPGEDKGNCPADCGTPDCLFDFDCQGGGQICDQELFIQFECIDFVCEEDFTEDCSDDGDKCNGITACDDNLGCIEVESQVLCAGVQCGFAQCDPSSGICDIFNDNDTDCPGGGGNFCNPQDVLLRFECEDGFCEEDSLPEFCSDGGNECNAGVCDIDDGCVVDPVPFEGLECQSGAGTCTDGECILQPPFETEKFYTEANKDFENNFFGTLLPIRGDGAQTVTAVIHPKTGTINSYNPGQYYAVTKVTANEPLDRLWIFEDDRDCTVETGISKMNPAKVPGGSYVAIMCDGFTEDLSDELAESGALRFHTDGFVEAHLEDVPAGCMVFLGVKYGPGLKGENVETAVQRSCENWEFVCLSQDDVPTTTEPLGNFPDECKSASFRDSAHRVLIVTGLPEITCDTCVAFANAFVEKCIAEGGDQFECLNQGSALFVQCVDDNNLVCED